MSTSSTTIYSGFHRKLKDRRLSWEDRLKIARYAWTTPAAFIPNKQQVLLDWLFGALLNKKKLKIGDQDALYIWLTLNDFVRSNFIKGLAAKSQLLSIRSSATQVMTEALSRSVVTETSDFRLLSWTLGACHAVLTASPISFLLTSRARVLNVVLASSLKLLLQFLQLLHSESQKEIDKSNDENDAMETDLESAVGERQQQQQRQSRQQQLNQLKKVVEAFALAAIDAFLRSKGRRGVDQRQILQFYLDEVMQTQLRLLVGDQLERLCSDGTTLRAKLQKLANVVLFDVDHKNHYENYLRVVAPAEESMEKSVQADAPVETLDEADMIKAKPATIPPLIKAVFDKLKSQVSADPVYVTYLVLDGLKSLNLPTNRCFTAATLLVESVMEKNIDDISAADVAILRAVFHRVASDNLVELFDDYANRKLRLALDVTLHFASSHPSSDITDVFALLVDLLKCDPQILDQFAVKTLRLTLVRKNSILHGSSEGIEVASERDAFFAFFLNLYKKLRRLDKWFLHLQAAVLDQNSAEEEVHLNLSKVAFKAIEDAGENLPLGTALTIWENLHEAQTLPLKDDNEENISDKCEERKMILRRISLLLQVEVCFLQKLALANHEHPENLSANVQEAVVAMATVEKRLWEESSSAALIRYRECRLRLESMLSFYLPRRHAFSTTDVYSPPDCCCLNAEDLDDSRIIKEVLLAPANWLSYYRSQISTAFLNRTISVALDKATSTDTGSDEGCLRVAALKFLTDESNHEIPNFVSELIRVILAGPLRVFPANVGDVDVVIYVIKSAPLNLLDNSTMGKIVSKMLCLLHERHNDFTTSQRENLVSFVEAVLSDFPTCLEDSSSSLIESSSPSEESSDASRQSSFAGNLSTLLDLCRLCFMESPERRRYHGSSSGRGLISIVARLVKIGFRRDAIFPLSEFLGKSTRPCEGDESGGENYDAQLSFLLPLIKWAHFGCQKLLQRKNPMDDVKLQRRELTLRLDDAVGYVVENLFLNELSLSVGSVVAIVKTFLGSACSALILDRRVGGTEDVENNRVVAKMISRLLELEPDEFSISERLAFLDSLKAVLRKPEWVSAFRDGFFKKRNLTPDLSYGRFLTFFIDLLPSLKKNGEKDELSEVVTKGELPTESFSVLDRFLGDGANASVENQSDRGDDEAMDDAQSDISKPTSIGAPTLDGHSGIVSADVASSSSMIDSILHCLQSLRNVESPSATEDEMTVSSKMISFITISTIEVDHRRLDLALRFCLDAFDASHSSSTSSSPKPLSTSASRQFIDALQNLAVGLALKCEHGAKMNAVERSVALSVILCLSKIVSTNPKKRKRQQGEIDDEEMKIHPKPVATIAVETLLALPLPAGDDDETLVKPTAAEFFLRYAEVINALISNHLHRLLAMAPTFYMTIDKLLKSLAGICDGIDTSSAEGTDDPELSASATNHRKSARECANALLRIMALFRSQKTELSKLAPYWISHFTRVMTTTPAFGKDSRIFRDLNSCVFCLMDLMDDHGFDVLRTLLPGREKELLHKLKKEYEATFKFKGKI